MIVAIIPARANSKSVKNKNLVKIGDDSLLAITIKAAKNSGIFDKIIVSTDGIQIKNEAIKYGATVIDRPQYLALDNSKSIDAVLHVISELGLNTGTSILLQPTSPFRTSTHIKEAYSEFIRNSDKNSLISITESDVHPYKMLLKSKDEYISLADIEYMEYPRQDLPKAYQINGAIYINKIEKLLDRKFFFISPVSYYEMDKSSSLDIDYPEDLYEANRIYSLRNNVND